MIRMLLVMALSALDLASPFAPVAAQDKKESSPKEEPAPSLKVGDPAPALKAIRWLQGEEVRKFQPGKAYVVHFWAPWCGNCVSFMPHLAELQARYQDRGLTVIGVSVVDPNNSEENMAAFVKKRGPSLKYTLAFASERAMYDTWVTAAGVKTMSCTFVVDKAGRIAYIGHPMYLPVALPKVVEGTATAKEIGDEMDKIHADVEAWLGVVQRDPKAGLQAIKEFEAKYPPLADYFLAAAFKLGLLLKYGKPGEAKAYSEALVAKAVKKDDVRMLRQASMTLRTEGTGDKELLALAVSAAREVVRIEGGADPQSLIDLADAYFASGDKVKAKEYANKAVAAARGESSAVRESIEKEARRLGAGLVASCGGTDNPRPTQDKKGPSKEEKPAASLQVGDLAPALKASKWLQGEEVKEFERGKVYVIEFWATWCGWCILMMPHTAELQAQYKHRGVTIIGYSARDPENREDQVTAFVKKRGPKLLYTFAYANDPTTYDAWMKAAGREGLPCAFVVGKAGRIAYIGHPMYLGVVLPMVVAGNIEAQKVSAEVGKIVQEWDAVSEALFPDHKVGLKALKEFEAKYPPLANNPVIVRVKLNLLPKIGEIHEAKEVAEALIAKAMKQENPSSLMQVAGILRSGPGKESKELLAVAVKAAEGAVQLAGDKDARALIDLAETYFAIGDKAKAEEFARKAVAAAVGESAEMRQYVEQRARKLEDKK